MKFDAYYEKEGSRPGDFFLGFSIAIMIIILFFYLATFLKMGLLNAIGIGITVLSGIAQLSYHPRKFIGIGLVAPFVLGLIVYGSCILMLTS